MLNLLSPQQKRELRLGLLYQSIVSLAIAITFMFLIFALLLLLAQKFLNISLENAQRELLFWQFKPEIKEVEELERKIKELNQNAVFLDGLFKQQVKFSLILENLAQDMPLGIRLENLSFKKSGEININGYAPDRSILLALKTNLEKAPYVSNFEFPLSNFTKTTNINFRLSFKLVK